MCIAAPGEVVSITGREAQIKYASETRRAMIADVTPTVGDWVLVQMGIIVKVLTQEESSAAQAAWKSLEE